MEGENTSQQHLGGRVGGGGWGAAWNYMLMPPVLSVLAVTFMLCSGDQYIYSEMCTLVQPTHPMGSSLKP